MAAGLVCICLEGLCRADVPKAQTRKYGDYSIAYPEQASYQDQVAYRDQVVFITQQIQEIQKDLDWLTRKIMRMKDFDRFVPQRMHDSIVFKKSKIDSLEKLKKRYQSLIVEPVKKHPAPDDHIRTEHLTGENYWTGMDNQHSDAFPHMDSLRENIEKQIAATGLENWLELVPHTTPLRLETRLPILFASASSQIPQGYAPFLKDLATLIKGHDVRVIVDGYADTDPINTRQYPSNFELGAARAAAVVRALVEYGIKPEVFKIGSTAQYRFSAQKTTEWKNLQRHVTIAVFFRPTT